MARVGADAVDSLTATETPWATPVEVADLDVSGTIVSVNQAWIDFCLDNGGDPSRCGPGTSWTDVCAAADHDPWAEATRAAISVATRGLARVPLLLTVPCHEPDTARWVTVAVSSRFDASGTPSGARVTITPHADGGEHHDRTGGTAATVFPSPTVLAEVVHALLLDDHPEGPLQVLLDAAVRMTGADVGAIWTLADPVPSGRMNVETAEASRDSPTSQPEVILEATAGAWSAAPPSRLARVAGRAARHVLATCEPVVRQAPPTAFVASGWHPQEPDPSADVRWSSLLGAPVLLAGEGVGAALLVARIGTAPELGDVELATLTTLASHGGLALGVRMGERRRADGQALHDRERLAIDLQAKVVGRLFTVGMGLERLASGTREPTVRDQLLACADLLDDAVVQLRDTVLRDGRPSDGRGDDAMT